MRPALSTLHPEQIMATRAKLFVGQVPAIYEEHQLRPVFAEYGQILDLAILRDKMTGQSKGAAFVTCM
eukprot:gene1572-442_t